MNAGSGIYRSLAPRSDAVAFFDKIFGTCLEDAARAETRIDVTPDIERQTYFPISVSKPGRGRESAQS